MFYTKLYRERLKQTQDASLNYAQLLRKTGQAQKAVDILAPFVNGRDDTLRSTAAPIMLNEYAAARISRPEIIPGSRKTRLTWCWRTKKRAKFHADADNLLPASSSMRKTSIRKPNSGITAGRSDGWKGDPSSVMNNLSVWCLAAQGMFDDGSAHGAAPGADQGAAQRGNRA